MRPNSFVLLGLVACACACGPSGSGPASSSSVAPALASAQVTGQWWFGGDGYSPEGQASQRNLTKTYTFLSDGTYVLETGATDGGKTSREVATGKWDLHPDSIILVQEHSRTGADDDTRIATKTINLKLGAAGKELTFHGEDGDCPGSDCTRLYRKK